MQSPGNDVYRKCTMSKIISTRKNFDQGHILITWRLTKGHGAVKKGMASKKKGMAPRHANLLWI